MAETTEASLRPDSFLGQRGVKRETIRAFEAGELKVEDIVPPSDTTDIDKEVAKFEGKHGLMDAKFFGQPEDPRKAEHGRWYGYYSATESQAARELFADYKRAFVMGYGGNEEAASLIKIVATHIRRAGITDSEQVLGTIEEIIAAYDGGVLRGEQEQMG